MMVKDKNFRSHLDPEGLIKVDGQQKVVSGRLQKYVYLKGTEDFCACEQFEPYIRFLKNSLDYVFIFLANFTVFPKKGLL